MIADLYLNSIPFLVIIISIIGIYYGITKPIYALYIIIFTFPLKNFYIFIGTSFEIWKILSLFFLFFKLPIWIFKSSSSFSKNNYFKILKVLIIYILIITVVGNLFTLNQNVDFIGGFLKNEGRLISQLVFFGLTINLMIMPFFIIKGKGEIINCLKALLYSVVTIAVLGIIQLLIFSLTRIDVFPIQTIGGEGHTGFISNSIFRVNSIAGEPKHMAMTMVYGLVILLLAEFNRVNLIKYQKGFFLILLINLFFTYSTTGMAWFATSIIVLILLYGFKSKKSFFLFGALFSLIFVAFSFLSIDKLSAFNKQASKSSLEPQDEAVMSYFLENPENSLFGVGLGNIHYYAEKYIPNDFPLFHDTPFKGNTGFLLMLGDIGLVGLIGFYIIFLLLINENLKFLKMNNVDLHYNNCIRIIIHFTFVLCLLFLGRYTELLYLMAGVLLILLVFQKLFLPEPINGTN